MADQTKNRIDGLRGVRYGEVLLVRAEGSSFIADVWNTMGFNDCPPEQFAELDEASIAEDHGALIAMKNGPRHWVLDAIEAGMRADAPTNKFGSLEMFLAASIDFGAEPPTPGPFIERSVHRDTVFEWSAGLPLHELVSPEGATYVMQSFSLVVDASQTVNTLESSIGALSLPEGWTLTTRVPDAPLRLLSPAGVATVLQDQLSNTYQRVDLTT